MARKSIRDYYVSITTDRVTEQNEQAEGTGESQLYDKLITF